MNRFLRVALVSLGAVLAIAVTSGCIVVPVGGGGGYYDHPHYWRY